MAVFPTAADLRRPVPTAGGVGNYRVAQQAMPGLEGAEALNQAGQQNQQIGGMLWNLGEQLDTAAAQEALNQIKAKRQELTYDPEKGFQRLKGGDVLKPGASGKKPLVEMPETLDAEVQEVAGRLLSPRAKAIFQRAAANEQWQYKRDMTVYFAGETEKYEVATLKDGNLKDMQEIAQVFDDPAKVSAIIGKIERRTRAFYEKRGLPSDAAATAATSDALVGVVRKAIATGDISAVGLYERYKDKIDAKDQLALAPALQTMTEGAIAQDFARGSFAIPSGVRSWEPHIQKASTLTGVPAARIAAIASSESGGKANAVSPAGAGGPMQFMPATAASEGVKDRFDPAEAIPKGAAYYKKHLDKYGGDTRLALMAYNWGTGNVDKWIAKGRNPAEIPAETRTYIQRVEAYEKSYAGTSPSASSTDSRVGDPLATSVNDATAGVAGVRTLENVVNVLTSPTLQKAAETADGVPNARQQMIEIEKARIAAQQANAEQWAGNPRQYAANNAAINTLFEQRKAAVQLYKDQIWNAVQEHMTKGGPNGGPAITMPRADIVSQLDFQQVEMLEKQVARAIAGTKPVTDWALFTELERDLTSADANVRAAAAKIHPYQFRDRLADDQYKRLLELQAAVNKGGGKEFTELTTPLQKMNAKLEALDINPNPKPGTTDAKKVVQFREVFQEHLMAFESRKGGKADPKEIDDVLKGVTRDVVIKGWLTDSKKPLALLERKDIPATEWQEMVNSFHQLGVPPSESDVLRAIILKRARAPVEAMQPAAMPSQFPAPVPLPGEPGTGSALPPAPPGPATTVRERYQRAMSVPSKDLATMGADAVRRLLEK